MNEKQLFDEIFDEGKLWKNKYKVSWCDACEVAVISCPVCKNSSCNGGGCFECNSDFEDFYKNVLYSPSCYLTQEEINVYRKYDKIKKLILMSIKQEEAKINFLSLKEQGHLSENDEKMFEKEL